MIDAVAAIGRGEFASEGKPFRLEYRLSRERPCVPAPFI